MFIRFATLLLLLSFAPISATQAQVILRGTAGISHTDKFGVSLDLTTPIISSTQQTGMNVLGTVELGVSADFLAAGGGMPCPPDAGPPCPDGSEFIPQAVLNLGLIQSGPFSIWGTAGGGVAISSAAEPDVSTGTAVSARTAPAVAYGVAVEYQIAQQVSLYGRYRMFSIFTGEREFTEPNGSFTVDVGTETASLLSAGIGVRL